MKNNESSNTADEYVKNTNIKRDENILEFAKGEKDYRKIKRENLDNFLDRKQGELGLSKELQKIFRDDL